MPSTFVAQVKNGTKFPVTKWEPNVLTTRYLDRKFWMVPYFDTVRSSITLYRPLFYTQDGKTILVGHMHYMESILEIGLKEKPVQYSEESVLSTLRSHEVIVFSRQILKTLFEQQEEQKLVCY